MELQSVAHRKIASHESLLLFMAITHSIALQFATRAIVGDVGNVDIIGATAVDTVAVIELMLVIDGVGILAAVATAAAIISFRMMQFVLLR